MVLAIYVQFWFIALQLLTSLISFSTEGFVVYYSHCTQNKQISSRSASLFARSKKKKKPKTGTIAVNRVAYRNYEVLETMTAGVSLLGTEVKAIRDGKMTLRDGFCRPDKFGRCFMHNVHIGQHTGENSYDYV